MYFNPAIKLSPEIPKAIMKQVVEIQSCYYNNDEVNFEYLWDHLESLIKNCHYCGILQGKDFNRIYEMFGKDWWYADLSEIKYYGEDTPLSAPIFKMLAEKQHAK